MREVLHDMAAFPLYAAGWVVGLVARFLAWCRDAMIAGYRDGRGVT
jgi:hypothetical protein